MEIMISDKANEVIKKLFDSRKNRYQNSLELMKCDELFFDYAHFLYYKCHKINLNCGGSYIDSADWIKNKNVTINPINKKDNKCFQYAVTEIKKDPQRITNIKPFISKYNWERISIEKLSALLRGITSKHYDDFYCLDCLYSFSRIRSKSKK